MSLADLLTLPKWSPWAACADEPPDTFADEHNHPYPSPRARRICDECDVRPDCLLWALQRGEYGVWGGMSTYQRSQLRRPMNRSRCPSCTSIHVVVNDASQVCLACGVTWDRGEGHGTSSD